MKYSARTESMNQMLFLRSCLSTRGITNRSSSASTAPCLTKTLAGSTTLLLALALLWVPTVASAANPAPVTLGTAATYSLLAGTGILNTGATTLTGDIGLSATGAIDGFDGAPNGTYGGAKHDKDAAAAQAEVDRKAAYDAAALREGDTMAAATTYTPGVYESAAVVNIAGTWTLDGTGVTDAVFIFNVDAALNTAAGSKLELINVKPSNVFWRVLGAVGTGANSSFSGSILAEGAITLGADSTFDGHALTYGKATLARNTVTTTSAPAVPTDVSANAGDAQASVSWTAPASNGGSAITSYTVTPDDGVSATTETPFTTADGATTFATVPGLTNGTAYNFTVIATSSVGNSPPSATSNSVTPVAPTAPGAPTGATANPGNSEARVSWTAPDNNGGSSITGYTVTSTPGGLTATTTGPIAATVTGLTNGVAYTFAVVAKNTVGPSSSSAASNSVTPMTVPSAPLIGDATAGNASALVTWTPTSDGGSTIISYTVTPDDGDSSTTETPFTTTDGSVTSATVSGLTNGVAYTFTVVATNVAGNSSPSAASTAVTPATVPGAPTGVSATAGNGDALVSWTAPTSNGGSAITSYAVTPDDGDSSTTETPFTTTDGSVASATVSGLTNGVAYTFAVVATNVAGNSDPSAATSPAVTPSATVPGAPTGVSATAGNGDALVSWTAPTSNGGSAITSYAVTPDDGDSSTTETPFTTTDGSVTSATVPGLTNGVAYTFTVVATNVAGSSSPSAALNKVTPAAPGDVVNPPAAAATEAPGRAASPATTAPTATSTPSATSTPTAAPVELPTLPMAEPTAKSNGLFGGALLPLIAGVLLLLVAGIGWWLRAAARMPASS
jgi:hypothetical protein